MVSPRLRELNVGFASCGNSDDPGSDGSCGVHVVARISHDYDRRSRSRIAAGYPAGKDFGSNRRVASVPSKIQIEDIFEASGAKLETGAVTHIARAKADDGSCRTQSLDGLCDPTDGAIPACPELPPKMLDVVREYARHRVAVGCQPGAIEHGRDDTHVRRSL
jgi:hypothetical protein